MIISIIQCQYYRSILFITYQIYTCIHVDNRLKNPRCYLTRLILCICRRVTKEKPELNKWRYVSADAALRGRRCQLSVWVRWSCHSDLHSQLIVSQLKSFGERYVSQNHQMKDIYIVEWWPVEIKDVYHLCQRTLRLFIVLTVASSFCRPSVFNNSGINREPVIVFTLLINVYNEDCLGINS